MAYYTGILSVATTIKQFHIIYYLHYGYIHNFYYNKQEVIDELFCQYIKHLLKDIDHPAFIQ